LGKVKTEQIKRVGKELMARFPNKFTSNFDENKRLVDSLTQGTTTRVRNQIAGYITRKLSLAQDSSSTEPDVSEEEASE
jgi:small subunit ribosomal protein S17e